MFDRAIFLLGMVAGLQIAVVVRELLNAPWHTLRIRKRDAV